jgi:H+-transporting ATPase
VVGGHLLLFVTRTERWFFLPPFPAAPLFSAIAATQVMAALMCGFGWLVPAISWEAIAAVWAYNLVWMVVLGAVRLATERTIDNRTAGRLRSVSIVTQSLQGHVPLQPKSIS